MKNEEWLDDTHLLEKWIKQCKVARIRQVEICKKKKSIIDGANKVERLLIVTAQQQPQPQQQNNHNCSWVETK